MLPVRIGQRPIEHQNPGWEKQNPGPRRAGSARFVQDCLKEQGAKDFARAKE
jgi:hypothetical protein